MAAALHQYDYIFAITTIFSFLDAWNIGANDVANSFATSVSSRSLTMKQAMAIAAVAEFSGSVSVGSRVTDTLRNKIIDPHLYDAQPSVLLLVMMCAIFGSSVFLSIATRNGLPVSTTHSIIGGLVGAATASVGIRKVSWGWDGVSQVFAAWVVAPGLSGVLGALLFLGTKRFVLTKANAVRNAFYTIPFYTFLTFGALTMLMAWKGVQTQVELTTTQVLIAVFSVATGATLLQAFFLLPYLWRKIVNEDWQLEWTMMWKGPWLLNRPPPPLPPAGVQKVNIKDYYRGHLTADELAYVRASETLLESIQSSNTPSDLFKDDTPIVAPPALSFPETPATSTISDSRRTSSDLIPPRPAGPWTSLPVLGWRINRVLLRGLEQDVITLQRRNAVLSWDIADMHSRAPHYDNRAEYMYSSLQILTASAASFIHGANDVSNSIGPFATAYDIWRTGRVETYVGVPIWILCFGGGAIVLGLLTYGYHVMRNLGNRLTLISPSRGFCMELASAITVMMATKLALPVSTTQCIAGATVGVGLANGDWRCINPRLVAWIYFGWFITVPVTGLLSGCLMALILNAPHWESNGA
ncbi:phosphate-repressible Na+ phosphate cotransporter [Colletotrichum tofieldiae]|uniref:Phosphate transporter n=1 Tax=Colletotrichum tofieldiae TaxID=708197 RepID=A0A166W1X6_9PEZI|nr:phosphate-repressible Na+ phosphate cotransporter [Colletotrichum tofieldiae]GKT66148.1 phosphate-repressible Na+ phosphate cotransporter [Colletotrichum tofieldiae]GKT70682.1 phosphate-repressible Na+ phosphate cotransporter [Colletotrichum tofieldiae]GKT94426.1 phosphate-repressible Na+ phosphate cotransporter [Colletotrichum tofieldiae]